MGLLDDAGEAVARLHSALREAVPTATPADQPVHTLYWPADRFTARTVADAGAQALALFDAWLPNPEAIAPWVSGDAAPGDAESGTGAAPGSGFAQTVWACTRARLVSAAVEDLRIDFEDGYGLRADAVEDGHATAAGRAVARALAAGTACPRVGVRIKALTPALLSRAARTLELFTAPLAEAAAWPHTLVVTLPKVTHAEQARVGDALLGALERRHGRAPQSIRMEVMVETTESLIASSGVSPLPAIVDAGVPRLLGVHLGVYDLTASLRLPPGQQAPDHAFCRLARGLVRLAVGSRVHVSDGASNVLPVGARAAVFGAWRLGYAQVVGALREGYPQGWDMHPGQLVVRHMANIAFWRRSYEEAAPRLRALLDTAVAAVGAQTVAGAVIDEPATGRALLGAVQRAWRVGAIGSDALRSVGVPEGGDPQESFAALVARRQASQAPRGPLSPS